MEIKPTRTYRGSGFKNDIWHDMYDLFASKMRVGNISYANFFHKIVEDVIVKGLDAVEYRRLIRERIIELRGSLWW